MKHYSFIMLKPDAIRRDLTADIIAFFVNHGYHIELFDTKIATSNIICEHYQEVIEKLGESFKRKACQAFDGQLVIPMIISSQSPAIIQDVRTIVGATDPIKADRHTVRGKWGIDSLNKAIEEDRCVDNIIHASDSTMSFNREIKIWFREDLIKPYIE